MLRLTRTGGVWLALLVGVAAATSSCKPETTQDAGPATDAGPGDSGAGEDSGPPPDGGHDAGPADAGTDGGPDSGCSADAACGITTPPNPGDPGWFCTMDSQCGAEDGGFCQMQAHRCSRPCGTIADCPVSWRCAPLMAGGENVCQCPTIPVASADTCNNVDDNCDGLVDNGNSVCPAAQVCNHGTCECPPANICNGVCTDLQNSTTNCGTCGHACNDGYVCTNGGCVCPSVAGNVVCQIAGADGGTSFVCADSTSDPRYCGACSNSCSSSDDCVAGQCEPSNHEWARWSLTASSAYTAGSVPGPSDTTIDTVTDSVTGLVWEKTADPTGHSWADAQTYCTGLGTGWRLPSRIELLSIVDYAHFGPALDSAFSSTWPSPIFWSASPQGSSATAAWTVDFGSGYSNAQPKTNAYAVRCVQ